MKDACDFCCMLWQLICIMSCCTDAAAALCWSGLISDCGKLAIAETHTDGALIVEYRYWQNAGGQSSCHRVQHQLLECEGP